MSQISSSFLSNWICFFLLKKDIPPNLYLQPSTITLFFILSSFEIGEKREGINAIILDNNYIINEVGRKIFGLEILVDANFCFLVVVTGYA